MTEFSQQQIESIRHTVSVWDQSTSIKRATEELMELCLALLHFDRNKATINDVLNEMADVKIALKHLEIKFGCYQTQLNEKVIKGQVPPDV
jgi:hypothetical protein